MSPPPATDQYEAITHNIRVSVEPHFLEEQSVPHSDRYVWAYTVMLENEGEATVQLKTRTWLITDGNGKIFSRARCAPDCGRPDTVGGGSDAQSGNMNKRVYTLGI